MEIRTPYTHESEHLGKIFFSGRFWSETRSPYHGPLWELYSNNFLQKSDYFCPGEIAITSIPPAVVRHSFPFNV